MSVKKIKVGIIGTGNIGTDLLIKIQRSDWLECGIFAGHNPDSVGMRYAEKIGVPTSFESIHYIEKNSDCCQIVFDATTAKVHIYNAPILEKLGKYTLDLTPAHIGTFCVPVVNLKDAMDLNNVNLVTCGGQATIPMAYALHSVANVRYIEIVATIASKSAGIGTRNNIDEFTQTTKNAIKEFTGIKDAKAIIVLNPAEPPIAMQNTLYAIIDNPDMDRIRYAIQCMEKKVQEYVPGYKVVFGPNYENGRVTISVQVIGSGDYLPEYAGNLDIITCSAIKIAETYAKENLL